MPHEAIQNAKQGKVCDEEASESKKMLFMLM